jgi:predicted esterase
LLGALLIAQSPLSAQQPTSAPAVSKRRLPRGFVMRTLNLPQDEPRNYVIFVPPQYNIDETHRWPVIVFLHGSGECGNDGFKQTTIGLPVYISRRPAQFPFITLMPQAHQMWFRGKEAIAIWAMMEELNREFRIDPDRVYLTGLSMGGFAAWELASLRPDIFAATVPVCGKAPNDFLGNILNLPVWAFHGSLDKNVPVSGSREAVNVLKRLGASPQFTEYRDLEHNCWDRAYGSPNLYSWMLQQRRRPPPRVIDYKFPGGAAQVWWIAAAAEEKNPKPATIHAEVSEGGKINIQTTHVVEWAIISGADPIKPGDEIEVIWNGKPIERTTFTGVYSPMQHDAKPQAVSP